MVLRSHFPVKTITPFQVGFLVVALMCGGDGMADIIGRRFGRGAKLPHNSNKSWAGSAAMLTGGALLAAWSHAAPDH